MDSLLYLSFFVFAVKNGKRKIGGILFLAFFSCGLLANFKEKERMEQLDSLFFLCLQSAKRKRGIDGVLAFPFVLLIQFKNKKAGNNPVPCFSLVVSCSLDKGNKTR